MRGGYKDDDDDYRRSSSGTDCIMRFCDVCNRLCHVWLEREWVSKRVRFPVEDNRLVKILFVGQLWYEGSSAEPIQGECFVTSAHGGD